MLTSYKSVLSNLIYHLYDTLLLKVLKVDNSSRVTDSPYALPKPFVLNPTNQIASNTILPNKLQRILITTMMTSSSTPDALQRDILINLYRAGTPNPLYLTTLLFYKKLFVTTDHVLRSQLGSKLHGLTNQSSVVPQLQNLLLINEFNNYSPLLLQYFNRQTPTSAARVTSLTGLGTPNLEA
jgi:hypothetical protein